MANVEWNQGYFALETWGPFKRKPKSNKSLHYVATFKPKCKSRTLKLEAKDVNEALIKNRFDNNSPIRDYVHPDDQTQPTNHFDSEDDNRTGCGSVRHCQQQQSYSGLRSPGRSYSTYKSLWLWRWQPHRLSKRQTLSTTTVLFRTTFIRTIKLNLLMKWLMGSNLSRSVN